MAIFTLNVIRVWRTSGKSRGRIGASPRTTARLGDRYGSQRRRAEHVAEIGPHRLYTT